MLKSRLKTAIPLIAIIMLSLFWQGVPGAICFVIIGGVFIYNAIKEFFNMTARMGYKGDPTIVTIFAFLLIANTIFKSIYMSESFYHFVELLLSFSYEFIIIAIFLFFSFARLRNSEPNKQTLMQILVNIAGFFYIAWCMNFIARIYFCGGMSINNNMNGHWLLLFFVLITKLGDTGGFFFGTISAKRPNGNHKITPRLSPNKSWEGLLGSIIFSGAGAMLFVFFFKSKLIFNGDEVFTMTSALFIGIIFAVLGFLGDIVESALKRAADVKDSGKIPGIGGALDMLDSLLLLAPIYYALLHIFTYSKFIELY